MRSATLLIILLFAVALTLFGIGRLLPQSANPNGEPAVVDSEKPDDPEATLYQEAHEQRMMTWRDENGYIPPNPIGQALQAREQYLQQNLDSSGFGDMPISHLTWTSRGPNNVGGRTRAVVVDPTPNSKTLWAGAVGGGIWKSTDGGDNWLPMNGAIQNYIVSCLTLDPNDPNHETLYAGTGEDTFNLGNLPGGGIFKTTDGGYSWQQLPMTIPIDDQSPFRQINRISVAPGHPNIVLASTWTNLMRTTDPGGLAPWISVATGKSRVVSFDPSTPCDLAPGHICNAIGEVRDNALPASIRAMWSTDAGATFNIAHYTSGGQEFRVPEGYGGRIELGYGFHDSPPSSNVYVYAMNPPNGEPMPPPALARVSLSTDGGHTFTKKDTLLTETPDPQPIVANDYHESLWTSPADPNLVVVGGVHVFRSTDQGTHFTRISAGNIFEGNQPHVDQHCVVHDPSDPNHPNRVYVCTDGGVYAADDIYTADGNGGWQSRTISYRTSQYYGAAGHFNGDTGLIYGGTQDNGTTRSYVSGDLTAASPYGGDGGFAAIDPNLEFCYGAYQGLALHRSNGPGCSEYAANIHYWLSDSALPAAPFMLDPNDTDRNRMLAGGTQLWRTNNVRTTTPLPTPTVTPKPTPPYVPPGVPNVTWTSIKDSLGGDTEVTALAIAPGNSNDVWVGYNDSRVYKTANGLDVHPTWAPIDSVPMLTGTPSPTPTLTPNVTPTPNPFARYVTRILIDKDNSDVVYVAQGGFSNGNLLKTTNGGVSWSDITGTGFPNVPVRGIARHPDYPDKLYAGTEIGLYSTVNGGQNWLAESAGPAFVSVDEVGFMRNSTTLLAATHGRGVWTAETSPPLNPNHTLYDFDGDERSDISVFRPSTGTWYLSQSTSGFHAVPFGQSGDIPVAADYDGDGKADIAVFRPSNGNWYWIASSNEMPNTVHWGQTGDIPVPADFDGDGIADMAVYRPNPTPSYWYILKSTGGEWDPQWGINTDYPYPADYNGDGHADLGVFRLKEPEGEWYLLENGNMRAVQFGAYGDTPAAGDYTGDGKADIALWRPSTATWYILRSEDLSYYGFPFGATGDIPVTGDYDGDGKTDAAVWRPSNGFWHVLQSGAGNGYYAQQFGAPSPTPDIPVPMHHFTP